MRIVFFFVLIASLAYGAPEIGFDVDNLKFGYISEGGEHSRTLGVANNGDEDLIIYSVDMPDAAFALTSPSLPATISPGASTLFIIRFHPETMGSFDGNLIFHSNDPATPNANLPGEARGVPNFSPGQIIWDYQGVENVVSCTAVDDINGDGFQEVVAESYDAVAPQEDHLFCISG